MISAEVRQELSRVHKLIASASSQMLSKTQEQQQVDILLSLSSSLLFEENQVVGFLPLKSYYDAKKEGHNKCAPE